MGLDRALGDVERLGEAPPTPSRCANARAGGFFAAAWKPTDDARRLTTGADRSLPEVRGHRPRSVRAINRAARG